MKLKLFDFDEILLMYRFGVRFTRGMKDESASTSSDNAGKMSFILKLMIFFPRSCSNPGADVLVEGVRIWEGVE